MEHKEISEGLKYCYKCQNIKTIDSFNNNKSKKDKKASECKKCSSERHRIYRENNKEKISESKKSYIKKNKKKLKQKKKEYYEKNKKEILEGSKEYRENNQDKIKEYRKKYYQENKEEIKEKVVKWVFENEEKRREYQKEYRENNKENANKRHKERWETDEIYKLSFSVRNLIRISIKNKGYSKKTKTQKILGKNFKEFVAYLNDNPYGFEYGDENIDLDHIIPLNSAETEEDVYRLNHYTNFQLLPSFYNRHIKSNNPFDKGHFEEWLKENPQ